MEWFKYTERRFADSFLQEGCIKLSELAVYRDAENLGQAVGDDQENRRRVYSADKRLITDPRQINEFEREAFYIHESNAGKIVYFNNSRTVIEDGPRLFAFCISSEHSLDILNKFNKDNSLTNQPPYDACVQIRASTAFTKALKRHLDKKYNFKYCGALSCNYVGRDVHWTKENAYFTPELKDPRYSWQKEFRILFSPPQDFPESSLIIKEQALTKYITDASFS